MHRDIDEHLQFLSKLFDKFCDYNLRLHPKKMTIATTMANFFGFHFAVTIVMVPFHPLNVGGSPYIPTPHRITGKHAVINVKNLRDDVFQVSHAECPISCIRI